MRDIVLYIGMSLDGYIADRNGQVDWLEGQDSADQTPGSYEQFIKSIDTVVMGWNTYHQITTELSPDQWVYSGMKSYVLTSRELDSSDEIIFWNQGLEPLMTDLRGLPGKDIWICGGASIVNQLVQADLIDRYTVTIIPTLLGGGIKLFREGNPELKFRLVSAVSYNGMTDLTYERR